MVYAGLALDRVVPIRVPNVTIERPVCPHRWIWKVGYNTEGCDNAKDNLPESESNTASF